MNFERCKRGLRSDRRGVSEVVGNILILMITVILFSAIVAYVNQIPVPEMTTKADFAASVTFETAGNTTATLTVTHAGGEVLDAAETAVYVQTGTTSSYDKLSEDADFPYSQWTTGMDWTKNFTVASESTEIIVTVIDLVKSSAVWTSQVSGGAGGTPPIVLQRYLDSVYETPTADPVKDSDLTFSFFVKVIDLDNDLDESTSGVWIDSSELPAGDSVDTYEESTTDGWFRFDFEYSVPQSVTDMDGKVIKIHAKDDAGHTTVSSFVVSITVLPTDIEYQTGVYDVEGGIPAYITWKSDGQGWGTYEQNLTTGTANTDAPTDTFDMDEPVGEIVFIRAASTRVHDLMGTNELTILDTRTNTVYVPTYNGSSTVADPFYVYTAVGGATVYECQFLTAGLPPGAYDLSFVLQGSGSGTATFKDNGPLYLTQDDSPIDFMPNIWLFNDETYTTDWGGKTTPFDVTSSSTSKVYVRLGVQDAADVPAPNVEDIRITDMRGDTQLHGTPPSGSMLDSWHADDTPEDNQTYYFFIDLRVNNADQWLSGTNAYTLKITRFSDANEGVYSLSCKLFIRASTARADFFVGGAGFMTGTSNFVNPSYLYYIQNNNFFTKRTMYDYSNAPSAADNYAVSAFALGDIDGDGDMDALMGQYRSNSLYYIENSLNTFGTWQESSMLTRPSADDTDVPINWIATGDINGDGDIDFAYSTHDAGSEGRTVVLYNNTYGATGQVWTPNGYPRYNDTNGNGVQKIMLEDLTGDDMADLLVLADGRIWIYDMAEWDPYSEIAIIPGLDEDYTDIKDFDVADIDGDGYLDIVTADDSSGAAYDYKGVWAWYYEENPSPDEVLLASGLPYPTAGTATNEIDDTQSEGGDALELRENSTAESPRQGKLDINMTMEGSLSSDVFQQLKVRVKVSATGGTASEGFYIWYSVDGDHFTPLIYVPASQSSYGYYTRALPSSVAGQTLTIRVTDTLSTPSSGNVVETLHLDYLAVVTNTFGSYDPYQIASHSGGWYSASIGNINGVPGGDDLGLEVVVAQDGEWMVYNRTSSSPETWAALSGWGDSGTHFWVRGDTKIDLHSSMTSDENPIKQILSYSSPRLFKVVDVNGDAYDDILVVNDSINPDITSQVALYLNIHGCDICEWIYYVVKDIAADFNTADVRGGITWLEADNLVAS